MPDRLEALKSSSAHLRSIVEPLRGDEIVAPSYAIEVMLGPSVPVQPDATAFIVDNIGMIVGFTGKPTGVERVLHVGTVPPTRDFVLTVGKERVSLEPGTGDRAPDLQLAAEAFIRLVYGRLDPDHTPPGRGSADLDELRRMFPGV